MKALVIFLVFVLQKVYAGNHLLEWKGELLSISYVHNVRQDETWFCMQNEFSAQNVIQSSNATASQFSFASPGIYKCRLSGSSHKVSFHVTASDDLPLRLLSTLLHPALVTNQYNYLYMSYNFLSASSYFPNVAKFFKAQMKITAETIDQIGKYLLAKQVTTSAMDGHFPPDYVGAHFEEGFSHTNELTHDVDDIKSAFQKAFNLEKEIVGTLTDMAKKAEALDDHELEEFIMADLIPPILKRLKAFSNYMNTLTFITTSDKNLGEFMFDREFS